MSCTTWFSDDSSIRLNRQGQPSRIIPVQFEKIEGIEENLLVMDAGMQLIEARFAIWSCPNRFPVKDWEYLAVQSWCRAGHDPQPSS
jgi:hypothetical protein